MPTSAAGNSRPCRGPRGAQPGFTLIELLATLVVMAMLTALAALAIPSGNDETARVEAQRLAALLDTAREQAVALGMPVAWAPGPDGYTFLRPSARGWVPLDQAPLVARAWSWLGVRVPADYQPRLDSATWYAGAVRIRVLGGGGALGAAPGWLVFGSEPVTQPMGVQLDAGSLLLSVSSNGAQTFRIDEQR